MHFKLIVSLWVGVAFGACGARAQVEHLGNSSGGSVYRFTFNIKGSEGTNATQATIVQATTGLAGWLYPAGGTAGSTNQLFTRSYPAGTWAQADETVTETFTVPPGQTMTFRWQYAAMGVNNGNWNISYTNYTGVAGTWEPEPAETQKQIVFSLPANNGANAVTWQIRDVSKVPPEVVAETTVEPGTGPQDWAVGPLPPGADAANYKLMFYLPGLQLDEGIWVVTNTPGTETLFPVNDSSGASPISSGNVIPDGVTPTPMQKVVVPTPTIVPTETVTAAGTGGSVWRLGGTSTTVGLSEAVYKEGVNKIVDAIKGTEGEKLAKEQRDAAAKNPTDGQRKQASDQGVTATDAVFAGLVSASQGVNQLGEQAGTPAVLAVSLPSRFGGATFNFNPFTPERLGVVASWFRTAVAWLTLVTLAVWVWMQLGEWVRGFSTVPQAKGNPVVGGTGAQATALTAAALMTTAVVTALTALVAWGFGDITLPSLLSNLSSNPVSTMPAGALWMLNEILPVATIVSALVARVTFQIYASALFASCATVVRFIVP